MSVRPIMSSRCLSPHVVDWRLLVKEHFAYIGNSGHDCRFALLINFCLVLGSLRTSLLYMVGELAGGGSVTVAVGVSDR